MTLLKYWVKGYVTLHYINTRRCPCSDSTFYEPTQAPHQPIKRGVTSIQCCSQSGEALHTFMRRSQRNRGAQLPTKLSRQHETNGSCCTMPQRSNCAYRNCLRPTGGAPSDINRRSSTCWRTETRHIQKLVVSEEREGGMREGGRVDDGNERSKDGTRQGRSEARGVGTRAKEGGSNGAMGRSEGPGEGGGNMYKLCIVMLRNVLFDRWMT